MDLLFIQILVASIIGSVVAMIGGVILLFKERLAHKFSLYLLSFAAGTLLGAALFELLPEAFTGNFPPKTVLAFSAIGILIFFILEKLLNFYHCHDQESCDIHDFSKTVLIGDALHNFLDGIVIALSFVISIPTGIITTIAVFFHEVPQEIGDFGILIHQGYSKLKTFQYNLLAALATPLGAIIGFGLRNIITEYIPILLGITAGSFIYISISDLIPELRHKTGAREFSHILILIAGLGLIPLIGNFLPE